MDLTHISVNLKILKRTLEKLTSELKLNDRSDNSGVYLDEGKDAADEDLDLTNSNSRKGR